MKGSSRSETFSQRLARVALVAAFISLAIFLSPLADAATYVVTNTNDSGAGSLRAAILNANGTADLDTISFNISGGGVHTIKPLTELPHITQPTLIDGYTQPGASANTLDVGNDAVLVIEIDGSMIPLNANAYGLVVEAAGCTIKGLVINNFAAGEGIELKGNNSHVRGNFIGTDPTGTIARPNDLGISVSASNCDIGWTTPADRNLISGNKGLGLQINNTQGNMVFGNYIGTNAAGNAALGNGYYGLEIHGTGHVIGNLTVTTRNVIAGNGDVGINVSGANHKIQGNYIGTNAAGNGVLGNQHHGLELSGVSDTLIGGTSAGAGNVISGNKGNGISIGSAQNSSSKNITVQGNFIGTDSGGALDFGNAGAGVYVTSNLSLAKVGGAGAGEGNIIAFNDGQGILAYDNVGGNTFSGNKIYSNDQLGIDLSNSFTPDGVTLNDLNDADGGPNGRQNFPVLTSAQNASGITTISGSLNSTANSQFTLDFYVNTSCDPSGYGEGQTYLGSATATTVGNDVTFSKAFPGFHAGQFVTATATNPSGSTSEFSQCLQVISPAAGTLQFSQPGGYVVGEDAGSATITVTRVGGSSGAVSVQYATVNGGAATANEDYTPVSGTLSWASGDASSKTFVVPVTNDSLNEGAGEVVNLALNNPTGGAALGSPSSITLEINEDDPFPMISISNVSQVEGQGGMTDFNFTVSLSAASAVPVTMDYSTPGGTATAGTDYLYASGKLTFNPGETSKTITVQVIGDTDIEPDETFQVFLNNQSKGNSFTDPIATGTIKDDDAPTQPSVQFDALNYTVSEGAGRLDVQVTRAGDTSVASAVAFTTVDGNAEQKADYNIAVGTLKFAPGETAKVVTIFITDDAYVEGGETFTLALSDPSGATLGAINSSIVMITDNDAAATATNPVDGTDFFIRQHYVDFLNREPEPAGFKGWQDTLNQCAPGDTLCDRVEVSSAFFRSDEFQGRGYFVYRFYESALSRAPKYLEFMADLRRVTGFLSDQQLEAEKIDFIKDFMARPEFKQKYDGISDAGAYVDALSQAAGVTLQNRDQLAQALQASQKTRAEVLRAVAESAEVSAKFYNKAFVVMQYFGYLRRDPDILYLNWIETLNQTNDYRVMVKGFLNSLEYRLRFNQ